MAAFKSKAMKANKLQEEAAAAYDIRLQQKEFTGEFCKCIVSHGTNGVGDDPTLCNDYKAHNAAAAVDACTNSFHTTFTTTSIDYNHVEEQLLSNNPYSTVNQGIKEIHFVLDLLYVFALFYMLWHTIMHYRWRWNIYKREMTSLYSQRLVWRCVLSLLTQISRSSCGSRICERSTTFNYILVVKKCMEEKKLSSGLQRHVVYCSKARCPANMM